MTHISAEVQRVAVKIGLDGDAFLSPASGLSGGQRRRLSIGMSIVNDPSIIILDEPAAGLDASTRRGLWQLISDLRDPHRLIVLTTHSMIEAETLCSRIAIISEGSLKCLGSGVHLKKKFGSGYTLETNVIGHTEGVNYDSRMIHQSEDAQVIVDQDTSYLTDSVAINLDRFVADVIAKGSGGRLLSAINHTRKYMIPKSATNISEIFATMESNKARLKVSEWNVSETTLEDIFIELVCRPSN